MPFITNKNTEEIVDVFYEDYGEGQPVILIHGWPLSRKSWEHQVWKIVEAGYRCISYDRRGFGISSFPWNGYDYSSLASDLNEIIKQLEKTIGLGSNVVIWPNSMKHKDINDMIIAGYTKEQIQEIIIDNTFSGVKAKLRFAEWRKINAQ